MSTVVAQRFAYDQEAFKARAMAMAGEVFTQNGQSDPAALRYLEQLHEDAIADDLEGVSLDDMVFLAAQTWTWVQDRKPQETKIRMAPGQRADGSSLDRDVIEIVTRDKPFLVDSITGEINAQGLDVLALFHPIITFDRDPKGRRAAVGAPLNESIIQVHLPSLDDASRERLREGIKAVLSDVEVSVADYVDMRARMDQAIDELKTARTGASRAEMEEAVAFLRWLRDDHFAFLGCRVYEFAKGPDGQLMQEEPIILDETGRGILRDPKRHVLRRGSEPAIITPQIEEFLSEPAPLIVAKSNLVSRVHRRVYMDYVGVKRYRSDGVVVGETRFVGLFTAEAYLSPAHQVPLVSRKVANVLARADKAPGSHNFKQLKNIVETYPRDELFQADEDQLLAISLGVLHLFDRPRTKLFIRRDRFDRFVSAFVFVPRERYNSQVRRQIGNVLCRAYSGRVSAFFPSFSDGPLARVHFIIGVDPFDHPEPDVAALEQEIVELTRTWDDEFERAGRLRSGNGLRAQLATFEGAFTAGYREKFEPEEGLKDAAAIVDLDPMRGIGTRAYRFASDPAEMVRLKLYRRDEPIVLSDVLPTLEAMGLSVIGEDVFAVRRSAPQSDAHRDEMPPVYVHEFQMRAIAGPVALDRVGEAFEAAIEATFMGYNESDGFNRLTLTLGLDWRTVCFMRTCAAYRRQTGLDPSQGVQEEALAEHAHITGLLVALLHARFDPAAGGDLDSRREEADRLYASILEALDDVASLDHDRVLRRLARLMMAIQRTSFYQRDLDGRPLNRISIKVASQELEELPAPKPFREIYVWSPRVEGVHIRFGPVARGGLRWSDRADDFRTEVLGLVKAQVVKNAVIVPVGSKGGFYPKSLPRGGSREDVFAEGREAYMVFIRGLLDVTDNLSDGAVTHPRDVVVWDGEDPYLVVAADKGTATFSDTANGIAQEYGFWLDDAFASGGSAGYDHKKMGITARGAWVAVQRHFREMGKNIQEEPFTVVGVGDMSGDVFGNGMLLSKQIKLIAAFDHRDIFIDPDPADPEATWAERKRLFELPRSTWKDYDQTLISKGGGVFSRALKAVALTPEIQAITGLSEASVSPTQLINALLKAQVELIWFGGIGTYIKDAGEQDFEVGDKANDAVRVAARDVRAQVIGEGANLGVTMAGRVALAKRGVRVNADFIDNSGGVDSSDHEVNIKILLSHEIRAGRMDLQSRNQLLEDMTDEVADKVLAHCYDQTLAVSIAQSNAVADLDAHERLIERLEGRGALDRDVEGLPSAEEFRERREHGMGLTRPELAALVSHAKIGVFDRILASTVPDDPYFESFLRDYFPEPLHAMVDARSGHRLKREIIATVLANAIVNLGGPTFTHRLRESAGVNTDAVARAFQGARAIFGFDEVIAQINALDNQAPAEAQIALLKEVILLLRRQTYWLARNARTSNETARPLDDVIAEFKPSVDALRPNATQFLSAFEKGRAAAMARAFMDKGAPEDVAFAVARLRPLISSSNVIDMAHDEGWPLAATSALYHAVGERFRFDELRAGALDLEGAEHFDRLALRRLTEDLFTEQRSVTALVIRCCASLPEDSAETLSGEWAPQAIDDWIANHKSEAQRALDDIAELAASGSWSLARITIAVATLREMAAMTQPKAA